MLKTGARVGLRNDPALTGTLKRERGGHESRGGMWLVIYDSEVDHLLDGRGYSTTRVYDHEAGKETFPYKQWIRGDQLELIGS